MLGFYFSEWEKGKRNSAWLKFHLLLFQRHKRLKRVLIYYDVNTQSTIFGDNPLCQATKQRLTVKQLKMILKNEMRKERTQREKKSWVID